MSTLQRFLAYSLRHKRPIKIIVMDRDGARSMNVAVQAYDDQSVSYLSAKNKKVPRHIARDDLLAATYARGDDGDSLKNEEMEKADDGEDKGPVQG
jgi:hypothetical protein